MCMPWSSITFVVRSYQFLSSHMETLVVINLFFEQLKQQRKSAVGLWVLCQHNSLTFAFYFLRRVGFVWVRTSSGKSVLFFSVYNPPQETTGDQWRIYQRKRLGSPYSSVCWRVRPRCSWDVVSTSFRYAKGMNTYD